MSRYKCIRCGAEFDSMVDGEVRCPQCAFRIVEKRRQKVAKSVKAI